MSNSQLVLIMDGHRPKNLVAPLAEWGYAAIVVGDLTTAVHQAHNHQLSATIVNGNGTVDILEFVFNIRDVDGSLPIIVVRASIAERVKGVLKDYPEVHFISTLEQDILPRIRDILGEVAR